MRANWPPGVLPALAFDFSGWGESEGTPRFVEDPATKTADIHAATAWLAEHDPIDASRIFGCGICASSGYMATAVADNALLQKLTLVAPWLHDPDMAANIYGGQEQVTELIAASEQPSAADTIMTAASATDESSIMYQAPYYTEVDRGLIPAYDNKFSALSWKPWLTYDAQASAMRLTKPTLLIGSPSIALPAGAEAYASGMKTPPERLWLGDDVTQFDFYDRVDAVTAAADAIARFFEE